MYDKIIELLKEQGKTVATMESCTGGGVVNEITNNPGASEVLKFSAITYSNEFKIKMGVEEEIIKTYGVYSIQTAKSMAKAITVFAEANFGIGITGKINTPDKFNNIGANDQVYIAIYDANKAGYEEMIFTTVEGSREENKKRIISLIGEKLFAIIKI